MGRWTITYCEVGEAKITKETHPDADCLIDVENEALCEVRKMCGSRYVMLDYLQDHGYTAILHGEYVGHVIIK